MDILYCLACFTISSHDSTTTTPGLAYQVTGDKHTSLLLFLAGYSHNALATLAKYKVIYNSLESLYKLTYSCFIA